MQSMTGFGASEKEGVKVEVRSLNHKYIDISVKMPSSLAEHEIPVRNIIKEMFSRGKFDVVVSLTDKRRSNVRVNKELAQDMYNAFLELKNALSLSGELGIDIFSAYRDIILTENAEYDTEAFYSSVREALCMIEEMRKNEGENIAEELLRRLKGIGDMHSAMEGLSRETVPRSRELLKKLIAEIAADVSVDENRLAQEIAIMAQKIDITEELTRLKSHMQQFNSFLSEGGAIGRKLDFLLQEMNRETNTIASKADDVRVINLTIELKTEIEKLREQVQNIQ